MYNRRPTGSSWLETSSGGRHLVETPPPKPTANPVNRVSIGAYSARGLMAEKEEADALLTKKKAAVGPPQPSQGQYFPLTSHAVLMERSSIRTYSQRKQYIVEGKRYVAMNWWWRNLRFWYFFISLWGMLPETWYMITNSATTIVAISLTGVLSGLQAEAIRLEAQAESWDDMRAWFMGFIQVLVFAMTMLVAIRVINWASTCYKTNQRLLNEARFAVIVRDHTYEDPDLPNYALEYDASQDPDVAMYYFNSREMYWTHQDAKCKSALVWFGRSVARKLERMVCGVDSNVYDFIEKKEEVAPCCEEEEEECA